MPFSATVFCTNCRKAQLTTRSASSLRWSVGNTLTAPSAISRASAPRLDWPSIPAGSSAAGQDNERFGYENMHHFLSANPAPRAVACVTDRVALGVLRAMREKGLVPRRDFLVTGHDDLSAVGHVDTADEIQQRRLAGAAATAQRHGFPAPDVEADVVEHHVFALAFAKAPMQIADADFGVVGRWIAVHVSI